MLISKVVKIKWSIANRRIYQNKGYIFTKFEDEFEVKVEDLLKGSHIKVQVKCDCKDCKKPYLKPVQWKDYLKCKKEDDKYYCRRCAHKLFAGEKIKDMALKNGKSFEQWCIENNRQDVLDRWDYELNDKKPSEICYGVNRVKFWFKCPKRIHKSELKLINSFTSGNEGSINCKACNSIAQWGIDNLGEDFLEKYWDWEKNTLSPWEIGKGTDSKKVWIKCQEKYYHGSYEITCSSFTVQNSRCIYCCNKKIHPLDSLGALYPEVLNVWSDKNNKKSPYEYAPKSSTYKVWWKCLDGKHQDFKRSISISNQCGFRCPECQSSKGEERISEYFINNQILYKSQKTFYGLIGLGNNLLSYDFYLPQYNLLIEYQGQQHEKYIKGFHKSIKDFERQVEHDRRKREYAENNKIKLLEIWYWDYDNIETILIKLIKEVA